MPRGFNPWTRGAVSTAADIGSGRGPVIRKPPLEASIHRLLRLAVPAIALATVLGVWTALAQDAPPADTGEYQADLAWPRVVQDGDTTFTVYQLAGI